MTLLVKYRKLALILLLLLSAILLPSVRNAAIPDNSLSIWFLESDPALIGYHAFQEDFGNDEFIILQVHEPEGVFSVASLARMEDVSNRLTALVGIERVLSVLSIPALMTLPLSDTEQEAWQTAVAILNQSLNAQDVATTAEVECARRFLSSVVQEPPDAAIDEKTIGVESVAQCFGDNASAELIALVELVAAGPIHRVLQAPLVPPPDLRLAADFESIRENAHGNPLANGVMVNQDATRAILMIQMSVMDDIDNRRDVIIAKVYDLVDEIYARQDHAMAGIGIIYSGLNLITQHDFGLFISLGYLIMFAMLWVVFRSILLVLASLGVIAVGNIFALGVMGAMGNQINMVTVVLPTLIIVLGIADAIHFPVAYLRISKERRDNETSIDVASKALKMAFKPCLMTTLTTMACFMGLALSPMATIRHLGIYAAIGLAAALLASVVFMANVFVSLGERQIDLPEFSGISRFLAGTRALLNNHHRSLIALTILVTGVSLWGASLVQTDTYTIGYLPAEHRVVRDHQQIEKDWGFYSLLEFTVRPRNDYRVDDPVLLAGMERFVEQASLHPKISDGQHLAQFYRYAVGSAAPEMPRARQLDSTSVVMARDFLTGDVNLAPNGDQWKDNTLSRFMTQDGHIGRITLVGEMMSAVQLSTLLEHLEGVAEDTLGNLADVQASGYPPLYVKIIDHVMTSEVRGFFVALAVIFSLLLLSLRSMRLALIALPPNLFPVVIMLGVMGLAGIDLDIVTATVAAIVIGVAIDDTVHFLYAWRKAEVDGLQPSVSLTMVFDGPGRAACVTTFLLITGFPILMLADVHTVFSFGLLTSIAALAALYGDLVLLPLLLRRGSKRGPQSESGLIPG